MSWSSLMRRFLIVFFAILTLIIFGKAVYAQNNEIILLEAEGPVTPAMAGY